MYNCSSYKILSTAHSQFALPKLTFGRFLIVSFIFRSYSLQLLFSIFFQNQLGRYSFVMKEHSTHSMWEMNSKVLFSYPNGWDKWLPLIRIATKPRSVFRNAFLLWRQKTRHWEIQSKTEAAFLLQVTKGTYNYGLQSSILVQIQTHRRRNMWSSCYFKETKLSLKFFFSCKYIIKHLALSIVAVFDLQGSNLKKYISCYEKWKLPVWFNSKWFRAESDLECEFSHFNL